MMLIANYDAYASDVWQTELLDDDTYVSKMYKNGEFAKNVKFGSIVLKPWIIFTDKAHFQFVLRDYCIQSGFAIVVDRSSPTRFTTQCLELNCNWRIHSSVLPDGTTWAIKSIKDSDHTCRGLDERNPLVNVKWAVSKLIDDIRANNGIIGKNLNDLLWTRYGVQMATSTLYKMRSIALLEINGGHDESYGHLPSIFISFKGAIDELGAGCRSLIGVDGAHLKGNYGGVLLFAVAIDANNELHPFAWAISSVEDGENWKFFIWHLKQILKDLNGGDDWCIISDRQKEIDLALTELWPKVGRRHKKNVYGIPCRHALRAILAAGHDPHRYVSTWYSVAAYKQCYSHAINSFPNIEHWLEIDQPTIQAPTMRRGIGRPSRQRRRVDDEPEKEKRSTTVKCSLCKAYGHNKQTCKGGMTTKEKASQDNDQEADTKLNYIFFPTKASFSANSVQAKE
ncbi:uncharacterized protein LOC110691293 [Chenopodium quinoa]|uniref:uncharacterized protein LOC110691293 n=1 Tax=Chenopodium quinoa TaxID=63459 RepID=UPI000B782EA6|nr:uncharacterized protein LOC110691293 [Chenopodium quinoa]